MRKEFEIIFRRLIGAYDGRKPLIGIDIESQFKPENFSSQAIVRNLNSSFLIAICGPSHRKYKTAVNYLECFKNNKSNWKPLSLFYNEGLRLITEEMGEACEEDLSFRNNLNDLCRWLEGAKSSSDWKESLGRVWKTFFPEGVSAFQERISNIESLRKRRTIDIIRLNDNPIKNPSSELIFASNVLLTLPPSVGDYKTDEIPGFLSERIKKIKNQPQLYWYDHPTWISEKPDNSEVIYGLRGLDNAIAYEKERGNIRDQDTVTCILSISVTHEGLQNIAKEWLHDLIGKSGSFSNLCVYAFAEADTLKIVENVFEPAALKYSGKSVKAGIKEVFGVNGNYGRHYSFLKAISAFWQVFHDPKVKATFKIDLDQVFPQHNLVKETGHSALEHLMTPLWGSDGIDNEGRKVKMGMLAGALVNHDDIGSSIFTPDVKFPEEDQIDPHEWIFCSRLPQAVSTEAEMMVRYDGHPIDGQTQCLQRVHVTGGTCGILVKDLRKFRPFTPTFIGRAEDQAYLLSVLDDKGGEVLRYAHASGLIMRHDKEAFATEAIKAASVGKMIGDYERILLFSKYAAILPWEFSKIKEISDPFTGCFISRIPITLVYLGFAIKGAALFEKAMQEEAFDFINIGSHRLLKGINEYGRIPEKVKEIYEKEKRAWEEYYLLLDVVEKSIIKGDLFALELKDKAEKIITDCKIVS